MWHSRRLRYKFNGDDLGDDNNWCCMLATSSKILRGFIELVDSFLLMWSITSDMVDK